jgi:ABC-2 type transport system ATP-binding protein
VFLDEPTGGVDPLSRRQFWDFIGGLSATGTTVLVTTHYLDEAEHCHRIAIIHAGRLAALGSTGELKSVFGGRAIVEILSSNPIEAMRRLDAMPEIEKTSVFGTAVHAVLRADARVDAGTLAGRLRREGLQISASGPVPPSLEDVFLEVAGNGSRHRSGRGQEGAETGSV